LDLVLGLSIAIEALVLSGVGYVGYQKYIGVGVSEPEDNIA
jgi:hypothetical protein